MVGAKRSNGESGTRGKPIHLNTFPSRKRKWKQSVPTSNQPRVSEQICGIDILQDGKSAGGEGSTSTGGLYDEVRLEGCLLHSPSSQGTLALPPVPLSREPKGVSVPTVRPFISPTSLYEDTEASSSSPSVIGNPGSVLPSLSLSLHQDKDKLLTIFHQVLELLQNIVFTVKREKCSAFPTRQLVFLGALLDSMRMILSLPPEKLTAITMAAKEIQQMQNTSLKELSTLLGRMNHAAQTGIWMAPLHYRSLQRDQIKALHLTNNRPELAQITISQSSMEELSWWTSPDLQGLNGQQLQTPPFEITVSTDASLLGWGATWPGTTIGGRWLPKEAQSHKPTGAKGSTSSTFGSLQVMHSTPETCSPTDVPTDGQYDGSSVRQQEGRHTISQFVTTSHRFVGSCSEGQFLGNSETHSRYVQRCGRHSISAFRQSSRMDSPIGGLPTGRLCYASQQPTSAVCLSISGPRGNNNGCLSLRLESVEELDLSTIGPDPENSEQNSNGQSNSFDTSSTLEGTVLVSQSAGNVGGLSETASTTTGIDNAPLRTRDRTSAPTQTTPNRVACIRERLHTGGLSRAATDILLSSWSEATQKRNAGPWRTWASWCTARCLCPLTAPVNAILSFLAELVQQQKLAYRTIGVYKSAISQTHDPIGETSLGELPIVSRFMKGVFRLNPPKPKLCSTWQVKVVLAHIEGQKPVEELSLKELSHKLAILLALTSAARAHELAALDLTFLSEKEESWEFALGVHVKQSRPNHPSRKIYLPAYSENKNLPVVHTLREYRKRTEWIRHSSRLLLAIVAPHAPVSVKPFPGG